MICQTKLIGAIAGLMACLALALPSSATGHARVLSDPRNQTSSEPPLTFTWWHLASYRNSEGRLVAPTLPPGSQYPLGAQFYAGVMSGDSGCNAYEFSYETLEGRMRL